MRALVSLLTVAVVATAASARADHEDDPGSAQRQVLPTEPDPATKDTKPAAAAPQAPAAAPTSEGAEVTVVGTKVSKTAGSAHVISDKKLQRFEHDDVHSVLTEVPGVYSRGEDGVGLRPNIGIRGVNPDRSKKVALSEDGVPFAPAPYSAPAAYYFPLVTRMTSIRVIKGPAAVTYGPQTVGGAIDLVTRSVPSSPGGGFDVAFGQYGYNKVHGYAGTGDEKMGLLVEGVHLGTSGFKNLPNGADTGFARNEVMVKGYYVVDPQARRTNELRLKLTYSDEVSNETYLGLTDADFRNDPNQRYAASALDRMQNHRIALAASHIITLAKNVNITTTVYRHDFARVWRKVNGFRGANLFDVLRNPDSAQNRVYGSILRGQSNSGSDSEAILIGPNQRDFVSQGVQTVLRLAGKTGGIGHRFEYGMRLHNDRIERRHSEDAFNVVDGQLAPEGSATVVTAFNEASTDVVALHAADAMTLGPITFTPGIRFEGMRTTFVDRATNQTTRSLAAVVLPGAGVFASLTDDFGLLAGAYRGFSPPAPGNKNPELSINYEGGARFTRGAARAEVIGFYNDYSNLTDVCTFSSGCANRDIDRQFDAGRARIYGFEAFVEHELAPFTAAGLKSIRFPTSVAYTLSMSEFARSFSSDDPIYGDVRAGDELPYVPRHQLSARTGIENDRAGANIAVTHVAKMREEAGTGDIDSALHTDAQLFVDIGGRYKITDRISVYANCRNLLDDQHVVARRPFGARPNSPRWVLGGVKLTF